MGRSARQRSKPDRIRRVLSDPEPLFQLADPVAGDAQFGLPLVLQPHQHTAIHGRKQLLHEPDVDDRGAVNSCEAACIELRLVPNPWAPTPHPLVAPAGEEPYWVEVEERP